MKILHTITSVDRNSGGTSTYMKSLTEQLSKFITVWVVTKKTPTPLKFNSAVKLIFFNFSYFSFQRLLDSIKIFKNTDVDLYHGNGLWQFPVHFMAKKARKNKIPYIISPHGMLEPWSLEQSKWKKNLAMCVFQKNDLRNAAVLHVTANMEAENIRNLGFENPIAVIPNGIDLKEFPKFEKSKTAEKKIVFLSRLHQKKGIENLIEAWSQVPDKIKETWSIDIVGNGEEKYIEELHYLITAKGLSEQIFIKDPMYGRDKLKAYQDAVLFVLPTYSENFGIVIAEALACSTPVITTKGTPWEELETTHSGWWIDIGVDPLKEALIKAIQTPAESLIQMGENGRKLIVEKYSIEAVAEQMLELYLWLLKNGKKPKFINEI